MGTRMVCAAIALSAACPAGAELGPGPGPSDAVYDTASNVDLAALDPLVAGKDIIVFGEDSHEMMTMHQFVARWFERLVVKHGVRVFVFEAAWDTDRVFADFMKSNRQELTPEEGYFLSAFESKPILDMLIWIRSYNRAHPDDPVHLAGFQPGQPVSDFRALKAFFARTPGFPQSLMARIDAACPPASPVFADETAYSDKQSADFKAGRPPYTAVGRQLCLNALDGLQLWLDTHPGSTSGFSPVEVREVNTRLVSLIQQVAVNNRIKTSMRLDKSAGKDQQSAWMAEIYEGLEATRARIFTDLFEGRYAGKKAFLWMHDWHAGKDSSAVSMLDVTNGGRTPRTTISVTERLSARYGDRLVSIGSIIPCGADCVEPAGSLEPAFAKRFGRQPAVIDLRKPVPGLPVDVPGVWYANFNELAFEGMVLRRNYDALVYFPATITIYGKRFKPNPQVAVPVPGTGCPDAACSPAR